MSNEAKQFQAAYDLVKSGDWIISYGAYELLKKFGVNIDDAKDCAMYGGDCPLKTQSVCFVTGMFKKEGSTDTLIVHATLSDGDNVKRELEVKEIIAWVGSSCGRMTRNHMEQFRKAFYETELNERLRQMGERECGCICCKPKCRVLCNCKDICCRRS